MISFVCVCLWEMFQDSMNSVLQIKQEEAGRNKRYSDRLWVQHTLSPICWRTEHLGCAPAAVEEKREYGEDLGPWKGLVRLCSNRGEEALGTFSNISQLSTLPTPPGDSFYAMRREPGASRSLCLSVELGWDCSVLAILQQVDRVCLSPRWRRTGGGVRRTELRARFLPHHLSLVCLPFSLSVPQASPLPLLVYFFL